MRALDSIGDVVKHVASISLSAQITVNYLLAKWKQESQDGGVTLIENLLENYFNDSRIKVGVGTFLGRNRDF